MIKPDDLRERVIRPTLEALAEYNPLMNTEAAVELLMGTSAQESLLGFHLTQIQGPALGIFQIEPTTHDSIWENYLAFRPALASIVRGLASQHTFDSQETRDAELVHNLKYAAAIARLVYWPKPDPLPHAADIWGQGKYWRENYNTLAGSGTADEYVMAYRKLVGGGF